MIKNSLVDSINIQLKKHGSNIYGDPLFKVVFSDDQLETRKGTFTEFDAHNTFIRTVSEIREVPKYPNVKSKWILERWATGDLAYHPSLVTLKNGVYVCIYVFQDKDQNYLPPLLKVAQIIVHKSLHPLSKQEIESRDNEIESKRDEKEVDQIQELIAIGSEESKIIDPTAGRESLSVGYGEKFRRIR